MASAKRAIEDIRSRPGGRQVPYVVFDGNGFLVLYKPPHWTMTTSMEMPRETSVQAWLGETLGQRFPFLREDALQAGLVQRLDVETSGPVVVATQSDAFVKMWRLRASGHFYREYRVLLHGLLPLRHCCGTLDYSLDTRRRSVKVCERNGQPARTRYQAIAAFSRVSNTGDSKATRYYTLIRVRILTGRLHQIRVHLRELAFRLGLPVCGVVGDYKYLPRSEVVRDWEFCPRVFLHARVLKFPFPGGRGGICRVNCELPLDLTRVLQTLTLDEELTAQFNSFRDFLHGEQAEAPPPVVVRTVHWGTGENGRVGQSRKRRQSRSRSPSHWCPRADEIDGDTSDETTREPSDDANLDLASLPLEGDCHLHEDLDSWGPSAWLGKRRIRTPSPDHWCPQSSPSPMRVPSVVECDGAEGGLATPERARSRSRSEPAIADEHEAFLTRLADEGSRTLAARRVVAVSDVAADAAPIAAVNRSFSPVASGTKPLGLRRSSSFSPSAVRKICGNGDSVSPAHPSASDAATADVEGTNSTLGKAQDVAVTARVESPANAQEVNDPLVVDRVGEADGDHGKDQLAKPRHPRRKRRRLVVAGVPAVPVDRVEDVLAEHVVHSTSQLSRSPVSRKRRRAAMTSLYILNKLLDGRSSKSSRGSASGSRTASEDASAPASPQSAGEPLTPQPLHVTVVPLLQGVAAADSDALSEPGTLMGFVGSVNTAENGCADVVPALSPPVTSNLAPVETPKTARAEAGVSGSASSEHLERKRPRREKKRPALLAQAKGTTVVSNKRRRAALTTLDIIDRLVGTNTSRGSSQPSRSLSPSPI
eukprot:TRINITY_DN37564_c0_g1_i1.p1 TRINITY_DN37564_c0_g1~~TRINITY_DN37564_c0_g1_i1.p1  ORF type:complete len:820 (-),score=94.01 TRINITY_DN37564_c0_g1_i1:172-2631(-)